MKPTKSATMALLMIAACSMHGAALERFTLNVGEFSRLNVSKSINVDYVCSRDSAGMAVFTASASTASAIGVSNKDGQLTVSFTTEVDYVENCPTVTVYSSYLQNVENSGDSTVRVLNVAPCPSFGATQVGNGTIVVHDVDATRVQVKLKTGNGSLIIYGKCDEASLNMTGTGLIQADGLTAKTVKCSAWGTGSIGCCPEESLKIHGMGSTTIYYKGSPKVSNRALGVKVEHIE